MNINSNIKFMKKRIVLALVVILILVVTISTFSRNGTGNIKIGVIAPLSGLVSGGDNLGQGFANGIILAKEEYEKKTGTKVNLTIEDDRYDSKVGLSAYQKLLSIDKVNALINLSSPTIDVIKDDVKRQNIPVLQLGAESEVEKDNVFQMYPDQTSIKMMADVANKDGVKNVTVVMEQIKAYEKFISDFESGYGGVTNIIRIPATDKDYRSVALKLKETNPDAVMIFAGSQVGSKLLLRLSDINYKPNKLYFDISLQLGLSDYKDILNDKINIMQDAKALYSVAQINSSITKTYKERFGDEEGSLTGYGYDCFNVITATYNKDSRKWQENISKYSGEGVTGKISFDSLGLRPPEFSIATFTNGELNVVN